MNPKSNKKSVVFMFQWALIQLIFITPLYSQTCYNVSNLSKGVCFRITSPLCAASPANNTLLTDDFFGTHYADNGTTSGGTGGTFPTNLVGYAPRTGAPSVINDDNGSGANNLMLELNESLEFRFNGVAGVTYTIGGIIRTVNGGTTNIKYSIYDSTGLELSSTILTGSSTKNGGSSGWNTFTKNITVPSCGRYFYVISHNGGSAVRIGQIILKVASGGGTAATTSIRNYTMQPNGTYTSPGNPTYATQAAMVAAGGVSTSCGLGFVANGLYQNTSGNIWYDPNGLLITDSSVLASLINAKTNNVLSSTPCPIDSDGDGLTDNIDIDDDNDAILDSVEKKCELINNGTFDGNYNNWQIIGRLPNLTYFANIGNRFPFNSGDTLPGGSIAQTINTTKGIPYRISFTGSHIAATVSSNIVGVLLEVTDSANNIIGSTSFTRTATTSYTPLTYTLDFLPTSTTTKITFKDISTQSLGVDPTVDDISIEMCDTDGDGIPNHLDLDSDNDGCSDALEGGATTDTTKNFKFSAPFGTNGLANSKETAADNGLINYSLSYNNSIDSLINGCVDSDGDGINDVFDIDDDNDGIPDVNEQAQCSQSASYTMTNIDSSNTGVLGYNSQYPAWMLETFTEAQPGYRITFNQPVAEVIMQFASIYDNDRIGDFSVTLGNGTVVNGIDFDLSTSNPKTNSIWTPQPNNVNNFTGNFVKFYGTPYANNVPYFRTANSTSLGTNQSWGIVSLKNIPDVEKYGIKSFSFRAIGANATSGVAGFAIYAPCFSILDTDGDGIPNHLDLDSDNDGCSDALEGGATTDTTKNFKFSAPFGTNGLANSKETVADNGLTNYNISYNYAIDSLTNACIDSDGDGINDIFDIDDDNDGVLDITEQGCNSTTGVTVVPIGINATAVATTSTINDYNPIITSHFIINLTSGPANPPIYDTYSFANTLVNPIIAFSDVDYARQEWFDENDNPLTLFPLDVSPATVVSGNAITRTNLTITGGTPTVSAYGRAQVLGSFKKLKVKYVWAWATSNNDAHYLSFVQPNSCNVGLDTDGDGIPNTLDLDSDNDGCSDAFESGATSVLTANYKFPAPYGANGLADSKETAVENGVINYTSTYANALSSSIKTCADTDGDGIRDIDDIDDDNDGITDCAEGISNLLDFSNPVLFSNRNVDAAGTIKFSTTQSIVSGQLSSPVGDSLGNIGLMLSAGVGKQASYNMTFTKPLDLVIKNNTVKQTGFLTNDEYYEFNAGGAMPIMVFDPASELQLWNGSSWVAMPANYSAPVIRWRLIAINILSGAGSFSLTCKSTTALNITHFNATAATQNGATFNITPGCTDIDTDNDGIPNRLDLDSDNDGCSDAFEAGATKNTSTNYKFPGGYGANGLDNILETVADNGIINYTLTYSRATSASIKSCLTPDISPNNGIVGNTLNLCQLAGSTRQLTAALNPTTNGGVINWYNSATASSALATAPTINLSNPTSVSYWVSQTVNGVESPRVEIIVNVSASPATPSVIAGPTQIAPNGISTHSISAVVNATGYVWTLPNGWSGTSTTPTIIDTAGSTGGTISVQASINGCLSAPATLNVVVSNKPSPPTIALDTVRYCQNAIASPLVASTNPANNGATLNWYTAAIGGTASALAPTPSTAFASIMTYYVSQTLNGAESDRVPIIVIVNPTPNQPNAIGGNVSVSTNSSYTYSIGAVSGATSYTWTLPSGWSGSSTTNTITINTNLITSGIISVVANIGNCSSTPEILKVGSMPSNPDVSGNSNLIGDSIIYCQNASATQLTATLNPSNNGGVLNWYTSSVGGTASSVAPTPSTLSVGTTYYYVSQTVSGIESGRSAIKIVVKPTPNQPNAISGSNTVLANTGYLYSVSAVSGATSYTWTLPNGWTGSSTTNSININTNSTTTGTILVTANLNSCSSVAQSLTIGTQPENPLSGLTGDSIIYCQGANALQLTASTNPANNGGVLNWYTSPTGGTPTTVAPTPSTLSAGITYYYVTQTVNGIESNRKAIKVIVKPIPNQPNMISGSNTVANNTNYTYSITTVPGATSYTWTLPNGWTGTSTTNSISINTNSITSGTITVTANLNGCSSAAQTMTVGTLPSNPLTVLVGDSVVYCQGASASQLVASLNPSNNGGVLNWYTVATGGTASMSAPTPNTSIAGITYYYVSQTVNGIESGRTAVKVIVKPVPNQPNAISGPSSVMSNTNYIYSISTVPGATSYTWTLPNGWTGTSTSNSITINTNSTTSGTISVTSNLNDCSSTAQTLSIGAQPNAPLSGLVGDSIVYCQGVTTTQLTASTNPINNGGTLNWYTTPFGGTASGFAPTPSTTASGTIYYYVSQTVNGIESNRTAIKIVVKPAPNQPNTISGSTSVSANTNYTYSVSSVSGATSYTWNLPNGWTGTSTTNSILVTTNNTTSGIISVTANLNGCSSDAQTLTIGTLPNNPLSGLTGDSILYCQGAAATQLTASLNPLNNGGILKWYTTPTGGVASTSAPTPSTVLAGVYYYYVSQTVNGVESGRTAIKVVMKSVPNQPNPIQGDTLVTKGSSRTYTVAIVPGATSYTWTLPNGWTGTSTTNTITVVADSVGGVITVKANSANCSSLTQTLNVRVSTNNDSDGDGIPDDIEKGNGTTPKDTDGDGTPDYLDPDSDNDGIPDSEEDSGCAGLSPCNPTDTDGDGNPDYTDTDSDNDGIPDSGEKGNGTTPKDTDGDGTPDYRDTDSDGDGIPDSIEKGSNGNNPKDTDGDGTPDYLDPDSDGDGIPDSIEKGSNGNTPKDSDGDGIPDYLDPDSDGDGIPDALEDTGCNGAVPCTPTDTDGDGIPDYLDPDSDNDGIPDSIEKGSGATPIDTDGDGIPDYRDLDSDGDGITDALEDTGCNGSVPCAPTDTDGDGKPDYLDLDSDGDGIPDSIEKGNGNTPQDTDGDGIPNYIDLDSDNDGILDAYENNVCIPTVALCDIDGDGIPNYMDLDSDNDSIPDVVESNGKDSDGDGRADGVSNPKGIPSSASNGNLPPNTDALGYADPYDLDSDNDGILDNIEKGSNGKKPRDSDGDGIPDYRDIDSDGDGNTDQGEGELNDCDNDGIPDYLDTDGCLDGLFPNFITPNGDGKNDNFVIPASYLKKHPGAKLIIYNRWGNVVWRSVGAYQNDWSGTHYDNNNLPDGVYYYLIELKDHFGEIKNGFVQIMRD